MVLVFLFSATLMMVRLIPGDPAELVLGAQATDEQYKRARADLGLDEPLATQFVIR